MAGAVVTVPVATGAPSDARRGSSVTGDGSIVAVTPGARTPGTDDPPPTAFAAVLAGLMLAPVAPAPAPSIEPGSDLVMSPPATVGVPDLSREEAAPPSQVEVPSAAGRAAPVRSSVAEAVLSTLMAFLPGEVDGQTVATAARTSTLMPIATPIPTPVPIPVPLPTNAVAAGATKKLIVSPTSALQPTDVSELAAAEGRTVTDVPVLLDTELPAELVVVEPRLPQRRGLATVATLVRSAMNPEIRAAGDSITPPPMMADPTAVAGAVAVSAGVVPQSGRERGTGPRPGATETAVDEGATGGDAPPRPAATPSPLFAIGGSAPPVPRPPAGVSAPSAPSPVVDAAPPPPTGSPSHATVDLAMGDGLNGRLRIAVRGEVIHATILADAVNAALLQNELPALRRALREHGFQEAHLTVRVPPATTGPELPAARREPSHPDQGGRDASPDQRPFTDDDRPRDRRRHPTEEEFQ